MLSPVHVSFAAVQDDTDASLVGAGPPPPPHAVTAIKVRSFTVATVAPRPEAVKNVNARSSLDHASEMHESP